MSLQITPLHTAHQQAGARLVDFAGWSMPLHYGSQVAEHHAVRSAAGVFDVSHMRVLDIQGTDASGLLRYALANDVAKLTQTGRALYSCMLNVAGGVLDDLIVYQRGELGYRLVVNAATAAQDLLHLRDLAAGRSVTITERADLAMLAVQGPQALALGLPLLPTALQVVAEAKPFHAVWDEDWMVARTGYTGEDGVEIMLPAACVEPLWQALVAAGVQPAGLGARDTLRLEAGMNLYGMDMDTHTTPLVANLAWTVAWQPVERDFVGRAALEQQRQEGVPERQVGLVLTERGVLRHGMRVSTPAGSGTITSGGFSPTLNHSIALARVPVAAGPDDVAVELRGRRVRVQIVKPVFVRHGQSVIQPL